MEEQGERELVERARRGDMDAFEALVRANERTVYTLCLRLLRNEQDALDASQETFLKAYTGLEGFRGGSRFSTWLYRVANNVCLDQLRIKRPPTASIDERGEDDESPVIQIPDSRDTPERALERRELAAEVDAALGELSFDQRQILLLREAGGLSYAELADILSLDEGTVKSRMFRARERLRKILCARGNFPELSPSKEQKGGVGR